MFLSLSLSLSLSVSHILGSYCSSAGVTHIMCTAVPSPRPPCIHLYRLTRTPSSGLFLSLARRGLSEKNGGEGDINKGGGGGRGKSTAHTSYRDRRNRGGSWRRKNRTGERAIIRPPLGRSVCLVGRWVGRWIGGGGHYPSFILWLDPQREEREDELSRSDRQ